MEVFWMLATIGSLLAGVNAQLPEKPNIVFVFLDDLGYSDIGYNNDQVLTPNMDELARNGRIIDNNYVQAVCSPSRSAMMSGLYPFKTTTQHMLLAHVNPHCLPTNLKTVPEYLKDYGYTSHIVGKWHLGFCDESCTPLERGFDSFYGSLGGAADYYNHTYGSGYDLRDGRKVDKTGFGEYSMWLYRDRAIDIIRSHNNADPMFLYMSFHAPHEPLKVPDEYLDMFPEVQAPRKTLLAIMKAVDDAIGSVVDSLKENNLWDNTLLVLTSDNGGDFGGAWDNSPLRGGKASLWEGGNRVPGFVGGPLVQSPGRHTGLFHVTDWLPTFIRLAGGDPSTLPIDGLDQTDMIIRSLNSTRQEVVYNIDLKPQTIFGQAAIRQNEFKLIWGSEGLTDGYGLNVRRVPHMESYLRLLGKEDEAVPFRPFVAGCKECYDDNKYFAYQGAIIDMKNFDPSDINSGSVHLFNLDDDPYERIDLARVPEYSPIVTRLKKRILQLIDEEYVAPGDLTFAFWVPQSMPAKFPEGAWSPGWCPDVDLTVSPLPRRGSLPTIPATSTAPHQITTQNIVLSVLSVIGTMTASYFGARAINH